MFGGDLSVRCLGNKPLSPMAFIVALILYSLTTVALSCFAFFILKREIHDYSDIINNWNTPAIMNIAVASECPDNYEQGYTNQWPGIKIGCVSENLLLNREFSLGSCSVEYGQGNNIFRRGNIFGRSHSIGGIAPIPLNYWGQVNGVKMNICVQRSTETWTNVAPRSGENCTDANHKKCGTSPELTFCTAEPQCPINNIKITTLDQNSPILVNCRPENDCFVLDNNGTTSKIIQFQRGDTYDALPTSQMRVNEYGMCKNMEKDNITPGREDFTRLDGRSTCDNEGANMWDKVDTMTETQLFFLNDITPQIKTLDTYGGYYQEGHTGDDYTWGLFSRRYVPWHINCRNKMQDMVNLGNDINNLKSYQLALFIVEIGSGMLLGGALSFALYLNMKEMWTLFEDDHSGEKMMKRGQIFCYLVKIIQLPLQIITTIFASEIDGFLITIAQYKCSDAATLQTLDNLQGDVHKTYYGDFWIVILACIIILFDTIYFIYNGLVKHFGYQLLPQNIEEDIVPSQTNFVPAQQENPFLVQANIAPAQVNAAPAQAQEHIEVIQMDMRQPINQ